MSNFFNIRAMAGTIILEIYGEISQYDMFEEFLRWQISEMGESAPLAVRMSSPGGDPRVAMSLYRIIKDHKGPSTGYIEYMCDSSAPIVTSACDKVVGNRFPFELMIHEPTAEAGWISIEDGQMVTDFLTRVRDDMARVFSEKTGKSEELIRQMMKATTFMNAEEALEFGFIDEIKDVEQTLDAKVDYKIAANAFADQRPKEFELKGRGTSSESEKPKNKPIQAMNEWMLKLAAKLGLGDTADESDVVLNVTELKAKAEKVDDLQSDIEAKDTRIAELEADLEKLQGEQPTEEEVEAELNAQVNTELEAAVADFKITASTKEGWAERFAGKPDELKATLDLIPEGAIKASGNVTKPKTKAAHLGGSLNDQVAKDFGVN